MNIRKIITRILIGTTLLVVGAVILEENEAIVALFESDDAPQVASKRSTAPSSPRCEAMPTKSVSLKERGGYTLTFGKCGVDINVVSGAPVHFFNVRGERLTPPQGYSGGCLPLRREDFRGVASMRIEATRGPSEIQLVFYPHSQYYRSKCT